MRITPQRVARLFAHDLVCMSDCSGDSREDHARRTQARFATEAVRLLANREPAERVALMARHLHDRLCIAGKGCIVMRDGNAHGRYFASNADLLVGKIRRGELP